MNKLGKILKFLGLEKGFVNISIGETSSTIIGAIFWVYLASIIEPTEYGNLHYFISIAMVASAFSIMGLRGTVTTFLSKENNEVLKNEANSLVLITTVIVSLVLIFLTSHIPTVALLIGLTFFNMTQGEVLGRRIYKKYSFLIIGQKVSLILLALLLYFFMGINGILLGFALSLFLFSVIYYKSLKNFRLKFTELRSKFKFALHLFSLNGIDRVINYVDKLLILPLLGSEILGLYQFGFSFLLFLTILPQSLRTFLLPQISSGKFNKRIIPTSLTIAIGISIIAYFGIPFVVNSFFPAYEQAITAAQIMIFGLIPLVGISILVPNLLGNGKSKPVLISGILRIVVLLPLVAVLGGSFGLIGLASSFIISVLAQSVYLFVISIRIHYN